MKISSTLVLLSAVLDAQHAKMRAQFKAETLQQLSSVPSASQLKKFEVLMEDERGTTYP